MSVLIYLLGSIREFYPFGGHFPFNSVIGGTKYSFHLVNSGSLCDPLHKLRTDWIKDFLISPKETYQYPPNSFLIFSLCDSFRLALSVLGLLSKIITKVNSLILSSSIVGRLWYQFIPTTRPRVQIGGHLFWNWLLMARKQCWKGKGLNLWWRYKRVIEIWRDLRDSLIHTLHLTDGEVQAKRWPPHCHTGMGWRDEGSPRDLQP